MEFPAVKRKEASHKVRDQTGCCKLVAYWMVLVVASIRRMVIVGHSQARLSTKLMITGKIDGVVAYESAHIDGVASEVVVRSPHSTQGHPETIEEVRRTLGEHIEAQSRSGG